MNTLSFGKHMNYMLNKANRVVAITRKSFEFMDIQTFKYLYKRMVRPQLEYATCIWHPHFIKQIEAIEDMQIRTTKWSQDSHTYHIQKDWKNGYPHSELSQSSWRYDTNVQTNM